MKHYQDYNDAVRRYIQRIFKHMHAVWTDYHIRDIIYILVGGVNVVHVEQKKKH